MGHLNNEIGQVIATQTKLYGYTQKYVAYQDGITVSSCANIERVG